MTKTAWKKLIFIFITLIILAYPLGYLAGLILTLINNNLLAHAAKGSYLWWGNALGLITLILVGSSLSLLAFIFLILSFISKSKAKKLNEERNMANLPTRSLKNIIGLASQKGLLEDKNALRDKKDRLI